MDKKELKFYEAPACEVVMLKASSALLDTSTVEIEGADQSDFGGDNKGMWD